MSGGYYDRLVPAAAIEDVLPLECWVFKRLATKRVNCTRLIGGKVDDNGAEWTEEMCCLPCRVRLAIDRATT